MEPEIQNIYKLPPAETPKGKHRENKNNIERPKTPNTIHFLTHFQ